MDKRTFLKILGLATIGTTLAGSVPARSLFSTSQQNTDVFPPEELENSLTEFFNRYFNGKYLDPEKPLPENYILAADRFEIDIPGSKNNIFDVADTVISECKEFGFDATSLKQGNMPEGMSVVAGRVIVEMAQTMTIMDIEELVNYDAIVRYINPISIKSDLFPNEWKSVKNLELVKTSDKMDLFKDKRGKLTIKKLKFNIEERLKILQINPELVFEPNQSFKTAIGKNIISDFITDDIKKLIKD